MSEAGSWSGAIARLAGLAGRRGSLILEAALASVPAGILESPALVRASALARRLRGAPMAPPDTAARVTEAGIDRDEVIFQEPVSGRQWRFGQVYFLGETAKRRVEAERPEVWTAYRARLFRDLPPPPPR
jgi:hypothetical protein